MAEEPSCAVCKGPARYVRDPAGGVALAFCSEHAPAATPPWIMIAQALALLAILAVAAFKLLR